MRLLHVIGSMDPRTGGPCQVIRNHVPHLMHKGNLVEVVCLDHRNSSYLGKDQFEVHALGAGRGAWNYHPDLQPWLDQNLSGYDAVILDGLWQYQSVALWKAASRPAAPPYYIFPHGMLDPWFQKISVRPMKAMRNWLVWKTVQHRVVNHAAGLLFTSEEECRLARVPFRPYRPQREDIVGLGLPDPPAYSEEMKAALAEKCPGLNGSPFLLFLGRIDAKKGIDLLIKAYAALPSLAKDIAIPKLVIAGPGVQTAYGDKMRRLAEQLCQPRSVLWPGMLTGDAKLGALYGCEASVLPSHQENFGTSVAETLACGRPVLISNQVNIWREIQSFGAALVRPDTEAGTVQLLQNWMRLHPGTREEMAAHARPCFRSHFSVHKATSNLLSVIGSKRSGKP